MTQFLKAEHGNAFFFILLGVAMFAALAYTISQGMRSDSTSQLSGQRASLLASDILTQAQRMELGVNRLRTRSVSENDISFRNDKVPEYNHPSPQPNEHWVFHKNGGNVSYKSPPPGANDGSEWFFTGGTCLPGIGRGKESNCATSGNRDEELIVLLKNINRTVCQELNKRLNINGIPKDDGSGFSRDHFVGRFQDRTFIGGMEARSAACFEGRAGQEGFHFYQVLMAR